MSENFMSAGTKIEEYLAKRKAIIARVAGLVAEACIDRSKKGKVNDGLTTDVTNIIKGFSVEEQNAILLEVVTNLSKTGTFGATKKADYNSTEDFGSYGNASFLSGRRK